MNIVSKLPVVLGIFLASSLAACGGKEPNTPDTSAKNNEPAVAETHAASIQTTQAEPPLLTSNLAVNDAIAKACGIARPTSAPQFDFNSSDIQADDKRVLSEIAKCLLSGPLAGKSISLTGRADSRGEPEYNMTLGAARANGVRGLLSAAGVPEGRLFVTSRGEIDATGSDEASYAKDRRVDIELR